MVERLLEGVVRHLERIERLAPREAHPDDRLDVRNVIGLQNPRKRSGRVDRRSEVKQRPPSEKGGPRGGREGGDRSRRLLIGTWNERKYSPRRPSFAMAAQVASEWLVYRPARRRAGGQREEGTSTVPEQPQRQEWAPPRMHRRTRSHWWEEPVGMQEGWTRRRLSQSRRTMDPRRTRCWSSEPEEGTQRTRGSGQSLSRSHPQSCRIQIRSGRMRRLGPAEREEAAVGEGGEALVALQMEDPWPPARPQNRRQSRRCHRSWRQPEPEKTWTSWSRGR